MKKILLTIGVLLLVIILMIGINPKKDNDKKVPIESKWYDNTVIYEVNIRQYTKEGTFKAFMDHLPRLKEMGVETLWLMPINPISVKERKGTLGSYYSIANYTEVNPEFGTKEDFKLLVDTAHSMGFKVMLDWVANHTGWDHPWITEHPEYYEQNDKGEIIWPKGTDWTDVASLNFDNQDMRNEMIDDMKYWVSEFNIDGYRCDHAGGSPIEFWEAATNELRQIKPDFYMLAEDDRNKNFLNNAFNLNYGWELHHLMNKIAKGQGSPSQISSYLKYIEGKFPNHRYPLNFTSNHDENSWNGTEYERLGDAVKPMAALSFTVPGVPLIYSGQEASFNRRLAFFEKDEIDWSNLELSSFYKQLIDLKKNNPALANGDNAGKINVLNSDNVKVTSFVREFENNKIIVLMNLNKTKYTADIDTSMYKGKYLDYFTGETVDIGETTTIDYSPWEYHILVKTN